MWKNLCVLLVLVQAWGDVTIPQHLVERFPELTTLHKRVTPSQKVEQTTLPPVATTTEKLEKTTEKVERTSYVEPLIVLGYKPTTTFYHPRPITPAQLIPPGTPWPDSPGPTTLPSEGSTASPFISIIKSTTAEQDENNLETTARLSTSIENKIEMTTNKLDDAGNKNVTTENKFGTGNAPENNTEATVDKQTTHHKPTSPTLLFSKETVPCLSKKSPAPTTHLVLTYKPTRPWYIPVPPTIGQIVPPGPPLPASPEEYPSFSQTTLPPWLLNKPRGNSLQELQSLKDLEPNALQYYGTRVTTRPKYEAQPFTSRVEKSTVSDLVDILQEMQAAGSRAPAASRPSELLPYDDRLKARKSQTVADDSVYNYRNQRRG